MSTNSSEDRMLSFAVGAVGGAVAWLLGYALTYLLAAPEIEESPIQEIIEVVQGEPATYELVGWTFYNAHFVDTVFQGIPVFGDVTRNFIGGDGFSELLYLIPVGLLVTTGLAIGRAQDARELSEGVVAGMTIVPGYLLLSAIGVVLFEIGMEGVSGAPALLPAIVLAGIVYPVVFGGIGGVLAAVTTGGS
ncbi:MAG: hypothetical protein V5A52_05490 [Halovenus sp.]|uniref:hypothetical protein n=1 Tax=Halovenus amylolytica TaxID=2500550 RepID=UPI000FE3F9EE